MRAVLDRNHEQIIQHFRYARLRAKLLRNYNLVFRLKTATYIAEMHSRNLVGEKRNLSLARALST